MLLQFLPDLPVATTLFTPISQEEGAALLGPVQYSVMRGAACPGDPLASRESTWVRGTLSEGFFFNQAVEAAGLKWKR